MTDFRAELQALYNEVTGTRFDAMARLAVFDRARAALAEPEPEGPTIDDILELCADHDFHLGIDGANEEESAVGLLGIVSSALARWGRPTPQPISVSERLPGPEDCDAEGLCWVWNTTAYTWGLFRLDLTAHSHWLSAHALPMPDDQG